jgi:hypothetical protein
MTATTAVLTAIIPTPASFAISWTTSATVCVTLHVMMAVLRPLYLHVIMVVLRPLPLLLCPPLPFFPQLMDVFHLLHLLAQMDALAIVAATKAKTVTALANA